MIGFEKRDHFAHTIKNDFIALIDRANLALHNDTWPKARSPPNPEMRPLLLQRETIFSNPVMHRDDSDL